VYQLLGWVAAGNANRDWEWGMDGSRRVKVRKRGFNRKRGALAKWLEALGLHGGLSILAVLTVLLSL
jgi:hypothetical protein